MRQPYKEPVINVVRGKPPFWIQEYILTVQDDYGIPRINLSWRSTGREWTSGSYRHLDRRMTLSAGTSNLDLKAVTLHECAHALEWNGKNPHNREFFIQALELYERYGLVRYGVLRDMETYPSSIRFYAEMGLNLLEIVEDEQNHLP